MKTLLLLLASLLTTHAVLVDHFAGALWSTACPVKVGAQMTLDAEVQSNFLRATITEDGIVIGHLSGLQDTRGRFRLLSDDGTSRLAGRIYVIRGSTIFIGTGRDENCRYKFQGRFRRSLDQ